MNMSSQHKCAMYCLYRDCEYLEKYPKSMHVHAHLIIQVFIRKYKNVCGNKHGKKDANDGLVDSDLLDKAARSRSKSYWSRSQR
jgi:hypothetical protein